MEDKENRNNLVKSAFYSPGFFLSVLVLCTEDGVITPSQNGLVACDLLCRWQLSQSAPRLSLQVILDSTGSLGSRTAVQA